MASSIDRVYVTNGLEKPDFHHFDATKLVEQLAWAQGRGAGLEFVFEAYPQTVSQEGDHDVGFDPLGCKMPDRADSQVAFERAENGFDFGKLNVLDPKSGRIAPLQVGAQQISPVTTGCHSQGMAIPLPAQA